MNSGDYDSIVDDQSLRGMLAKDAVENGRLPRRPPDQVSDGPREGVSCTVCALPLSPQALGYELQFVQDGRRSAAHFLHVSCFAAWETLLTAVRSPSEATPHDENARGNGHANGRDRGPGR